VIASRMARVRIAPARRHERQLLTVYVAGLFAYVLAPHKSVVSCSGVVFPQPQFCRSAGIGMGMLYVLAPTPTPPWQLFGGVVQIV
jgi:hypothetical protein